MTPEQYVAEKLDAERAQQHELLARLAKEQPQLWKAHDRAWKAYLSAREGNEAKGEEASASSSRLWRNMDAQRQIRERLDLLDDPAEAERRIQVRERLAALQEKKRAEAAS